MASARKLTRIQRRERLEKLFDKGRYVYFTADDDGGVVIHSKEEATDTDLRIWVCPPNPLQREQVVREAQAARARAVVTGKDPNSNEWITIKAFISQLSDDGLVDFIMDLDEQERLSEARRETLKEKEWEDFNDLRDAMRQYEEAGSPSDDPEWKSLLDRDAEFGRQVFKRGDELREAAMEANKLIPRAKLEERAFGKRVEQAGSAAFMRDYEMWTLFYGCRDDVDHSELYFLDPADLKAQPEDLQDALGAMLASFVTEAAEAKNLPGVVSGSTSSEPPVEPEISESSTPKESSA